jgi:L-asparaginase / beta-aspartyl-peptidase
MIRTAIVSIPDALASRRFTLFALVALAGFTLACTEGPAADASGSQVTGAVADATIEWGLVVHGGAGTITPENMTPELEAEYRGAMEEAMRAGHAVLRDGGSSLDAVVAAIQVFEDSPLFNSGRGAVFTAEGTNSMDASIMYGPTLAAGAIAGVMHVRHPISLAREVMEASPHVMLSGEQAEEFGELRGVEMVDPSYFHTERRWQQLQDAKAREAASQANGAGTEGLAADRPAIDDGNASKFGTVGVVALDREGAIAAGTSTGGMTNKKWGRIGDSPIIGAGTYAGPECGVSATGWGEYFIRNVVAYDICARMDYKEITLAQAAHEVIMERLEAQEPETGGIVSLDGDGNISMTFNSAGMYRGYVDADGEPVTAIYR